MILKDWGCLFKFFIGVICFMCFVCFVLGVVLWGGTLQIALLQNNNTSAIAVCLFHTNQRNKGLISVDRRTSLLSHVQYPVPNQSRLQWIYHSQCQSGD